MINALIEKAKSAISQPISQPAQVVAPEPAKPAPKAEIPSPAKAPAKALTPKEQAEETAKQVGYNSGDEVGAVICRHQPARHPHLLFVEVPDWSVPVRCWVKDAASWMPANPPYNRLKARYTGMASVEGDLIFESSDVSRKSRLLKAR
jgi:hypothetical protein